MCGSVRSGPYRERAEAARRTIGSTGTGPLTHTRCMRRRRFRVLYAVQGIAFGLLMPFTVPLLAERGLDAARMGLVLGVAGVASLAAYPLWGAIADAWLGRARTVALAAALAAVGGVALIVAGDDPLVLTVALSLAIVGALAWGPLIDAITLEALAEGSTAYGRIRTWASAGWAGSAMAGGWLWGSAGPDVVFGAFVAFSLALLLLVASGFERTGATASAASDAPRPSARTWLPLLLAPLMLGFLASLFVASVGEHAAWRFIALRILDQGGSVFLVGLAAALPAIVEIPIFGSSRRLASRLGLRNLYVAGAATAAVLMALVVVAPEPWMVTGLRTLEGASYAMRYMAMVLIVGALLPSRLYAMGQSMAWLFYAGLAPILADVAGGLVYEGLGAAALFGFATIALAGGGAMVWLVLRGDRFGPQRAATVPVEVPVPPAPA